MINSYRIDCTAKLLTLIIRVHLLSFQKTNIEIQKYRNREIER